MKFINYEIIMRPLKYAKQNFDRECSFVSNMLIAIIRYANNKCHFIMFDLLSPIILRRNFNTHLILHFPRTRSYIFILYFLRWVKRDKRNWIENEWYASETRNEKTKAMSSHQEKVLNCYKILFKETRNNGGNPFSAFSSHSF